MNLIRFASFAAVLAVIGLSSVEATHPIILYRFAFDPDQSNLNISGGFAGINEDYSLHGVFELAAGDHGVPATFPSVNAVLDGSSFFDGADLDAVLNLTGLEADTLSHNQFLFEGTEPQGADITLQVEIENNVLTMWGQNDHLICCDFFAFEIEAVAHLAPFIPGDANDDGKVDATDLDVVKSQFGTTRDMPGDVNGDGTVDAGDVALIRAYMSPSSPTPEPATALLLAATLSYLSQQKTPIAAAEQTQLAQSSVRPQPNGECSMFG